MNQIIKPSYFPPQPRQIISRKKILAEIAAIPKDQSESQWRQQFIAILKHYLDQGRSEIYARFMSESDSLGLESAHALSYLLDQVMRIIIDTVKPDAEFALVAVGGYGRGELAPFSDIDLLFLVPSQKSKKKNSPPNRTLSTEKNTKFAAAVPSSQLIASPSNHKPSADNAATPTIDSSRLIESPSSLESSTHNAATPTSDSTRLIASPSSQESSPHKAATPSIDSSRLIASPSSHESSTDNAATPSIDSSTTIAQAPNHAPDKNSAPSPVAMATAAPASSNSDKNVAAIEKILYLLWDLGLKVGQAVREIDSCIIMANEDLTVKTASLEARYIWGNQKLFSDFQRQFHKRIIHNRGNDFATAKLFERDQRTTKMGDSRYVLEPNIKDGKGGLRDLQTLVWIAKFLYQVPSVNELAAKSIFTEKEIRQYHRCHQFLWSLRFHLHMIAGRASERISFDVQTEIAKRMKYTDHAGSSGVERFMKHYFLVARQVGSLLGIFCASLTKAQKSRLSRISYLSKKRASGAEFTGFTLIKDRLSLADGENGFIQDPVRLIKLFHLAGETQLEINPETLRLVSRSLPLIDHSLRHNPEANRLFLASLNSAIAPDLTLRHMNEAGVLGRFVPDFGRIVAQMQYDMYHVYTVDEHTLFAIGILHKIEKLELVEELPLASSIFPTLQSRRALFVAVLLHDIAKGRKGDHSILGEEVALRLCPRFGLSAEETETVAWLVRHHLIMSTIAFRRDLQDPKTIDDFVILVQSPERLKLLLVLTVVDIRAVGPKVWNNWKAVLLRQLYALAAPRLATRDAVLDDHFMPQQQQLESLRHSLREKLSEWSEAEFADYWSLGSLSYWLSADSEILARQARLVKRRRLEQAPLAVETRIDRHRGVTELTVCTDDRPGLFMILAGALAVSGANIVDARIFTLANGVVLDGFSLQDGQGGAFDRPDKLARLSVTLEQTLNNNQAGLQSLPRLANSANRNAAFTVVPRVMIDNSASATYTVIEVNGRDRPGLLYDICRVLKGLNLQIGSAKITTFGERAVDVFYLKDMYGLKLDSDTMQQNLRKELLAALESTNEGALPIL